MKPLKVKMSKLSGIERAGTYLLRREGLGFVRMSGVVIFSSAALCSSSDWNKSGEEVSSQI